MQRIAVLAGTFAAALVATPAVAQQRPEIILVHGAFEDAGVWSGVSAALRADGFVTTAVDLPGRPSNPAPASAMTLDTYTAAVRKAVQAAHGRVILVGHSFGGLVISGAADAAPGKVKTLVYVAALLPRTGDTLLSLAKSDPGSQVAEHLYVDQSKGIASIPVAARADLFANDGTPEQRDAATKAIVDEPLVPLAQPIQLKAAFAQIDKVYIHTSQDRVVSPIGQKAMVAATPVRLEITLNTGHTPFLTAPGELVRAIEQAAR
jgi:pimeloyl-ACP methyl ester carboxylesterase